MKAGQPYRPHGEILPLEDVDTALDRFDLLSLIAGFAGAAVIWMLFGLVCLARGTIVLP